MTNFTISGNHNSSFNKAAIITLRDQGDLETNEEDFDEAYEDINADPRIDPSGFHGYQSCCSQCNKRQPESKEKSRPITKCYQKAC
jgi:hypothetical protein